MTKIFGTSDLHLDGNRLPRIESPGRPVHERLVEFAGHQDDILVLAGDTCEVASLRPNQILIGEAGEELGFHETRLARSHGFHKVSSKPSQTMRDLEDICRAFKQVYAVVGNHEFYQNVFDTTIEEYRELTQHIPNFRLLENETVEVEGVKIIATALWTDFNMYDWATKRACQQAMNDYFVVQKSIVFDDQPKRLTPEDVSKVHVEARNFVLNELEKLDGEQTVLVMTHHAPIMAHANPQRYGNSLVDYGYACTDMEEMLLDHAKQVEMWFHGHTHDWKLTNVGDTKVATFARGYDDKTFRPQMLIDTLAE